MLISNCRRKKLEAEWRRQQAENGRMGGEEAEWLLQAAIDVKPASDFVASVEKWFDENGFITEAQAEVLRRIVEGS